MTLRVAVIGCGVIGRRYAAVLQGLPGVAIAGYADPDGAARAAAVRVASAPSFPDHRTLLELRPDAVCVFTPDHLHRQPVLDALAAGAAVLVEKPLASNPEDAEAICRAAEGAPRAAMVGHLLRFDGRHGAAKQAVGEGKLGRLIHVHAHRYAAAPDRTRFGPQVSLLTHLAVHDIDLIRWITGQEVTAVTACALEHPPGSVAAIDAHLRLSGHAVAALEIAWTLPRAFSGHIWTGLTILGMDGCLEVPSTHTALSLHAGSTVEYRDPSRFVLTAAGPQGTLREEIIAFVDALRRGHPAPIPLSEGLRAVQVAAALGRAIPSGTWVTVEAPPC